MAGDAPHGGAAAGGREPFADSKVKLEKTMKRVPGFLSSGALAAALLFGLAAHRSAGAQDAAALRLDTPPANSVWLDSLDLQQMKQDYGTPHAGRSVDNQPLTLHGVVYPHGIGTHATTQFSVHLKRA